MDIQAEKLRLIEWLTGVNDIAIIEAIKSLKSDNSEKGRISVEQYNKEIEEAEAKIDRGEFYTQEDVEKMSKKW